MPVDEPQVVRMAHSGLVLNNLLYTLFTLYMLAILVCWAAPWLSFELRWGPLRYLHKITDPAFRFFRRVLPDLGPFDFAPLAALVSVFILRLVFTGR